MVQQPSYWKVLTRRKVLAAEGADGESKLNRVLGVYDLTALGVGSTLGAGVYVLAGQIARDQAGPSVMLSFAIAALASLLAGICYAEFGARVPKAGSAYVYSYVCIGEFVAFVIGWNLILEYMIGTASVCRGISLYLDTLINDTLKHTFAEVAPINVSFLGSYFDFFAFGLVVVFGVALAFGVETSAIANNFCTCLNIAVLLFVIIAGSIKANFANWTIDVATVNATTSANLGEGGFFPFGFSGTLKGAATCFFGFVGFDCIATTGEEVRNPRQNIPRSILYSLLIIFLCYFGVSTVLTLMVPYYQQDPNAPLPYAFKAVGWDFAMWIVSIGGLIGLLASLFGALFPLPRVMYSMADDGLLFRFLGKISPRYRVPVVGSIFAACITALISGLFDLDQLVNLLSIGTLLAYSVVAISVTILRYMDNCDEADQESAATTNIAATPTENSMLTSSGTRLTCGSVLAQLFNCHCIRTPNTVSTRIVGSLITIYCLLSFGIGYMLIHAYDALIHNQLWSLIVLGVLVGLAGLVLLSICLQPREAYTRVFRVPLVPIVPAISMFINIYLMLQLDTMTWVRFGVWMIIGLPMFIACWCMHDIKNPAKRNPERIEFARALKASASLPAKATPYDIKPANGLANGGFVPSAENSIANGSSITMRTGNSIKSLDEIKSLNECCDELVEWKHPNGKIFYVEETKSNTSNETAKVSTNGTGSSSSSSSGDEEKSVIAMLDNVLLAEDDDGGWQGQQLLAHSHSTYDRKISVDSEMLPSVIETTIVATIHCCAAADQIELERLPESEHEQCSYAECQQDQYEVALRMAEELVNDLLDSADLWDALEERRNLKELHMILTATVPPSSYSHSTPTNSVLRRASSATSATSMASTIIEDALHSEKFKQRLSRLIMQPPPQHLSQNSHKNHTNDFSVPPEAESPNSVERAQLKQSKSETDIQQMVLRVIGDATSSNSDTNSTENNSTSIPQPPKFDPVLYKTINSLRLIRERPTLAKLIQKDKGSRPVKPVAEPETQVPFRQQLEAILQRGPSHHSQKRPDIIVRRPLSVEPSTEDGPVDSVKQPDEKPLPATTQDTVQTSPTNLEEAVIVGETPTQRGHR